MVSPISAKETAMIKLRELEKLVTSANKEASIKNAPNLSISIAESFWANFHLS